jgi:hypothetical protein
MISGAIVLVLLYRPIDRQRPAVAQQYYKVHLSYSKILIQCRGLLFSRYCRRLISKSLFRRWRSASLKPSFSALSCEISWSEDGIWISFTFAFRIVLKIESDDHAWIVLKQPLSYPQTLVWPFFKLTLTGMAAAKKFAILRRSTCWIFLNYKTYCTRTARTRPKTCR